MSDFLKSKLAFAVAMLAGLFTAWPISDAIRNSGFPFAIWSVHVGDFYALMVGGLALAVYLYGFQLLSERNWSHVQRAGDFIYAVAWVIPIIVLLLWFGSLLSLVIGRLVRDEAVVQVSGWIVAAITSSLSIWLWLSTKRSIDRKETTSALNRLDKEVTDFFTRAKSLLNQREYDLAVTEAYKSVEVAARKRLCEAGRPPRYGPRVESPLRVAEREGLVPTHLIPLLHQLRNQRKLAAHGVEPMSERDAKHAVHIAGEVLMALVGDERDGG